MLSYLKQKYNESKLSGNSGTSMAAHQMFSEPQVTSDGKYFFREVIYSNEKPWHFLPVGFITRIANKCHGEVYIENSTLQRKLNAKSAMTLVGRLEPKKGHVLKLTIEKDGHISRECYERLSEILASNDMDAYIVAHRKEVL